MKRTLALALLMSVALSFVGAATCRSESSVDSQAKPRVKKSVHQSRTIKLHLGLIGFLSLPAGYKAYYTGRTVDAWGGYILSPDNSRRIEWSAGMVQTPFSDGEDKFVWVKREKIVKVNLQYGLKHTGEGEVVAATVGWANFTMLANSESDIDKFLKVVRGYKMEQCGKDCVAPLPAPPSNNGMQRTRIKRAFHLRSSMRAGYPRR